MTYKYDISFSYYSDDRAVRINNLILSYINSGQKITQADMETIQLDSVSERFLKLYNVFEQMDPSHLKNKTRPWLSSLLQWNGDLSYQAQSSIGTVFETWYMQVSKVTAPETETTYWLDPYYLVNVFDSTQVDRACALMNMTCIRWAEICLDNAVALQATSVCFQFF